MSSLHYQITADLKHSLAGRRLELRVYVDGSMKAVYNEQDLKMAVIDKTKRTRYAG